MMETMYEEVSRRIEELRRPGWKWVQRTPMEPGEMCAVYDCWHRTYNHKQVLSTPVVEAIAVWMNTWYGESDFYDLIRFNDLEARSVEDVIVVLEKFRADLQ
jgi:hypothetical protein